MSVLTCRDIGATQPRRAQLWGLPATSRWFFEATEFEGSEARAPRLSASPVTLEKFLEQTLIRPPP